MDLSEGLTWTLILSVEEYNMISSREAIVAEVKFSMRKYQAIPAIRSKPLPVFPFLYLRCCLLQQIIRPDTCIVLKVLHL
jgi:hypothetical protein